MSREFPRLRRVESRWDAVSELTAGFVTVGTQAKCVFVEGANDCTFFSAVQNMLASEGVNSTPLEKQRAITFIDASNAHPGRGGGAPSGGRNNVRKWVEAIPSTQIAGIVDRDDQPLDVDRIHVLCRHSLECYLLDPLFFFALLLEHGKAPQLSGVKLEARDARSLLNRSASEQQLIVDAMLQEMRAIANPTDGFDAITVAYHRGHELNLASWFLYRSAKPLMEPLHRKFGMTINHSELIRQYELMEIIPLDLVEIFEAVQRA